jgi:hypothetical protein
LPRSARRFTRSYAHDLRKSGLPGSTELAAFAEEGDAAHVRSGWHAQELVFHGSVLRRGTAALLELLAASAWAGLVPPGLSGRVLLRSARRLVGLGTLSPGRDARYSPPGSLPCLFRLLPELPGHVWPAGLLADERKPSRDVLGFPDSGNGVAAVQDLFRPRIVLRLAGAERRIAVCPADPSPSPGRVFFQPRLIQLVRCLLLSCLEVRAGQRSAEVPGGQPVFVGESPEPLRGHLKPCRAQLRVMLPAVLEPHFEVLAPIEQGLRHREAVVELPDRPGTDGVAQPQHVRPGIEPDPAARDEIVALIGS